MSLEYEPLCDLDETVHALARYDATQPDENLSLSYVEHLLTQFLQHAPKSPSNTILTTKPNPIFAVFDEPNDNQLRESGMRMMSPMQVVIVYHSVWYDVETWKYPLKGGKFDRENADCSLHRLALNDHQDATKNVASSHTTTGSADSNRQQQGGIKCAVCYSGQMSRYRPKPIEMEFFWEPQKRQCMLCRRSDKISLERRCDNCQCFMCKTCAHKIELRNKEVAERHGGRLAMRERFLLQAIQASTVNAHTKASEMSDVLRHHCSFLPFVDNLCAWIHVVFGAWHKEPRKYDYLLFKLLCVVKIVTCLDPAARQCPKLRHLLVGELLATHKPVSSKTQSEVSLPFHMLLTCIHNVGVVTSTQDQNDIASDDDDDEIIAWSCLSTIRTFMAQNTEGNELVPPQLHLLNAVLGVLLMLWFHRSRRQPRSQQTGMIDQWLNDPDIEYFLATQAMRHIQITERSLALLSRIQTERSHEIYWETDDLKQVIEFFRHSDAVCEQMFTLLLSKGDERLTELARYRNELEE